MHAVFRGTEAALERVERARLVPALTSLLKKLRGGLVANRARYDAEMVHDLDVYLGVAAQFADGAAKSLFGNDAEIEPLVRKSGGLTEVDLFGRRRMVDFSQLEPRGHYASTSYIQAPLDRYFTTMMWLSRLELNLVSRSCKSSHPGPELDPSETPREARAAMALADLIDRTGASIELSTFEDVYSKFAGGREDVSPAELSRVMRGAGIAPTDKDAFTKLKTAIGSRYARKARTHFMVEGTADFPVIATMMGPRTVPDVAPLTNLVHDRIAERKYARSSDVAFVLGHDRAKVALAPEIAAFGGLGAALDTARADLAKGATGSDVYASWMRAILALGPRPSGVVPSFMKNEAYDDARMGSALVGFGQLRHAFILLAAQGYDAYGCEIPDAYVEPLPAVFDALSAHVKNLRAHAKGWEGLDRVVATLASIARAEITGAPLAEPQKRWLSMVSEYTPRSAIDTGEPPKWTGWYFDMFEDREHGATKGTAFVADYFTFTNTNAVKYLGADGPRLAVFVVDTGGEPRAMVGPVAKGFETDTPIATRLNDERAHELPESAKKAPWRASHAVAAEPEPKIGLVGRVAACRAEDRGPIEWRVAVRAPRAVGPVKITFLDHHGDPLAEPATVDAGPAWKTIALPLAASFSALGADGVQALHVRVEDLARAGAGSGAYDWSSAPGVFAGKDWGPQLPVRIYGVPDFGIGAPAPESPHHIPGQRPGIPF
jgi:hypothetical protein